jgi:uncharacterized protein (DUF2249 family)
MIKAPKNKGGSERMLDVEYRDNIAVIDVRERIRRGEHPKQDLLDFVGEAKTGTVIEMHLPHRPEPLVQALKAIGVSAVVNELEQDHYRLMCVKM